MTGQEFAAAMDAALTAQGLSLAEVRERVQQRGARVSVATLSFWRSGARVPDPVRSAETLVALEGALGVARGHLISRVAGRSRRMGAIGRMNEYADRDPRRMSMLRRLDVSPPQNFRMASVQQTIDIGPRLGITRVRTDMLVQCVSGQVETLGFVDIAPAPTSTPSRITACAGGVVESSAADESQTVFGFRLVLDRPLLRGETAMIELLQECPDEHPLRRSHCVVAHRRVRELLQWYRFSAGVVPDWFEEDETTTRTRTSTVSDPVSLHRARVDFGPGEVLARWGLVDDL